MKKFMFIIVCVCVISGAFCLANITTKTPVTTKSDVQLGLWVSKKISDSEYVHTGFVAGIGGAGAYGGAKGGALLGAKIGCLGGPAGAAIGGILGGVAGAL